MKIDVKTTGYKFRVSDGTNVYDVVSKTELGLTKSNEIIKRFFDNFRILNEKKEEIVANIGNDRDEYKGRNHIVDRDVVSDEKRKNGKSVDESKLQNRRTTIEAIWRKVDNRLDSQFTVRDYKDALKALGFKYTDGSWEAVPGQQLRKLCDLGKVEKVVGTKPLKFQKKDND